MHQEPTVGAEDLAVWAELQHLEKEKKDEKLKTKYVRRRRTMLRMVKSGHRGSASAWRCRRRQR